MSPSDGNKPTKLVNLVDLAECNSATVLDEASLPKVAPLAASEATAIAGAVSPVPALTQTVDDNPETGGGSSSSSSGGDRATTGVSEHSNVAAAGESRTSLCKPQLAATREEELLAEVDHLQQRLKDASVERDLQVAIARDDLHEKQQRLVELLVQQEDAERSLSEAQAEETRMKGECTQAEAATAASEQAAAAAAAAAVDATAKAIQLRAAVAQVLAETTAAAEAAAAEASRRVSSVALPRNGLLQQGIEAPLLHIQEPASPSCQQYHALGDNSPVWRLLDHRAWLQRCFGRTAEPTAG
mmetsp:Transcript_41470/g.82042  ORF Transcript_41470/g.82042 Transcript_41470/m.82042 type:complete len:300 (-) Transcript_41470:27-926(-)